LKILLFDIDGTLMLSGGAGRRAMDRAFFEIHGIENAFDGIAPYGKTDPAIFTEIFSNHGLGDDVGDEEIRPVADLYTRYLPEEVRTSTGAELMPGVAPLLDHLAGLDAVVLGLLTGNFERTARTKLSRFDLNRYFSFGAFGSDDGDRVRLVPVALRRAAAHTGRTIAAGPHVVVIGDTPRDVECALVHGATAVGVATTHYTIDDLQAAGAHHVFQDLANTAQFTRALDLDEPDPPDSTT
jgi:phosphoglycolate phosphatase-like HAD superfamily hydrolase